jgi:hypothetical protein
MSSQGALARCFLLDAVTSFAGVPLLIDSPRHGCFTPGARHGLVAAPGSVGVIYSAAE